MKLDPLFHWAPSERRRGILAGGLVPYAVPCVHAAAEDGARLAFPYVCLSPTPSMAWGLSGAVPWVEDEFDGWDLWQVRLSEKAEVHVLPSWGGEVQEVRTRTAIGPDCVWYVATRTGLSAEAA